MNGCQYNTQAPTCFSQRSRCVSLQFSPYSSDVVCTCSSVFPKTSFLISVQAVHIEYEKSAKELHPTECEQYLNE